MIIEPFGELEFSMGWKKYLPITFNNVKYDIVLKVQAYNISDEVLTVQKQAYISYINNEQNFLSQAENVVRDKFGDITRFVPSMLLISRNGDCALLCDDFEDPDEGIAITFGEMVNVFIQSEYL